MATLKIIYESQYGQTQKIAEHMAELVRDRGHDAEARAVADFDVRSLGSADAFVVLAPIYLGKHPRATRDFVAAHGDRLNAKPSLFVSVSGGAGSSREKDREEARQHAVEFLATTTFRPNLVRTIGGAIAYPRYDFFTRLLMKMISKREGRSTDTSRIHELTDWAAVERMTLDLLAFVEPKPTRSMPRPALA
jgi:menaquinone-dependent protoporphyrinogen oxidase